MNEEIEKLLDTLPDTVKTNIKNYLEGTHDQDAKDFVIKNLKTNPSSLIDAFFQKLTFGTGGARGIMGIGTNRLNKYTIQTMAQGLANYIKKQSSFKTQTVLIGYDNRNNSQFFAQETANVLSANNIQVLLFKNLRPTPLVSFGCRYKKCIAAIMITASHNPPEYNGFKVFWEDGGQVIPPHDTGIIQEVNNINSLEDVKTEANNDLIQIIDDEIDLAYLSRIKHLENYDNYSKENIKIVYTNLHGTGLTILPEALKQWGFNDLLIVEKQKAFDGNFTNAPSPNPENPHTLQLGISDMITKQADILIATDPDADRIAVAVNHNNKPVILTGNQTSCILLDYILKVNTAHQTLTSKDAAIKSIVTTEMFRSIAKEYKIQCFDVLTGFKYIAEKINSWEKEDSYNFIFGAEESCGYLATTAVRDKDSISTACIIAEIVALAKQENKTLVDILYEIYQKHGVYREKLHNINLKADKNSLDKIQEIMTKLRTANLTKIGNYSIKKIEDYEKRESYDLETQETKPLDFPRSNVLSFWFEDNSKLVIRPSGTEPKIKIYAGCFEQNIDDMQETIRKCDSRNTALIEELETEMLND
jgi:phosphomannomutase